MEEHREWLYHEKEKENNYIIINTSKIYLWLCANQKNIILMSKKIKELHII